MEGSNRQRENYLAAEANRDENSCGDTCSGGDDGESHSGHACEDIDLRELEIGFDGYLPRDGNWERYGQVIGRMKRLKKMLFYDLDEEVMRGDFALIFNGISRNRSISNLSFHYCGLIDREIFIMLTPFFKDNHNFESLKIVGCELGRDGIRFLAKALTEFSSLKEFELSQCGKDDDGSYIKALTSHSRLRKICLRENRIGKNGCAVLASLFQEPDTELATVEITDYILDDAMVVILATGMAGNSTLKSLDLSRNPSITETGWMAIFAILQNPDCGLKNLSLQKSWINDAAERTLAKSLTNNSSLKVLDLSYRLISGGRALFEFLRSPSCALEELHLFNNRFSDDVTISLAHSLINNRSLKSLDLSACHITNSGWRAFSSVLLNPRSVLEILHLSSNEIDDDAVGSITNALAHNRRLRSLHLCNNFRISTAGWMAFFTILRNPNSALEKLDITGIAINDSIMISIANSLARNKKLIELQAGLLNWNITADGWRAFSRTMCNKSSILSTHQSNHTLQKLCQEDMEIALPADIRSLLVVNREHRSQAARHKIIKSHFSGSHVNIQPFAKMELKVIPFVLAWMAQDSVINTNTGWGNGCSLLYQFVGNITAFFDFGDENSWVDARAKRRKIS